MIEVEEGGEYRGERYIWCIHCGRKGGMFEGRSIEELTAFLAEHQHEQDKGPAA